jgi:hypothetical protein
MVMKTFRRANEKELRAAGFMTAQEFVDKFTQGLESYLTHQHFATSGLHHPEDLASGVLTYAESLWQVVNVFGVGNTNKEA